MHKRELCQMAFKTKDALTVHTTFAHMLKTHLQVRRLWKGIWLIVNPRPTYKDAHKGKTIFLRYLQIRILRKGKDDKTRFNLWQVLHCERFIKIQQFLSDLPIILLLFFLNVFSIGITESRLDWHQIERPTNLLKFLYFFWIFFCKFFILIDNKSNNNMHYIYVCIFLSSRPIIFCLFIYFVFLYFIWHPPHLKICSYILRA